MTRTEMRAWQFRIIQFGITVEMILHAKGYTL
jgi:hypothetical protein